MPAPDAILQLVQQFKDNADDYRKSTFNEHQTRVQFINPFWKALGWDMDNSLGYAEGYKDVLHEAALKVGGSSKAPDYSFGIGATRKFFLEAKKPSVNLEAENDPAYQVRYYAYTAGFPLSVLTNFRQLAVYDGKVSPARSDKPTLARLKFYSYEQYAENWDEIAALLSREAILKGAFDRFAASKTKRGTVPVDVLFLREIEGWRQKLAEEIAAKNTISEADLNQSVGRIIDRIIFLRICEENGIEPGQPLHALKNGVNTYARLVELFRTSDNRYNSGLFHFNSSNKRHEEADEITPSLVISNPAIKGILARLYYPETPYAFDYLPLDILGQIYERFLGKVITLKGKKASVDEKPEVRKAGGVYYTPTYIVSYIVQNTLGRLVEGKSPDEIKNLRVLDPACGSGSFLLGAYDFLLKWHLEWYRAHEPESLAKGKNPPIYQAATNDPTATGPLYRLTSRERKRIALDHLFGVDLDAQAVEVTKLSLVLKVLEGETAENLDNALKNHKERALPDLGDNIKCGNSLIGPDFYNPEDPQEWTRRNALSDAERQKLNDFSWKDEFPKIIKSGGFDCVIGNPPYIDIKGLDQEQVRYFFSTYETVENRMNVYAVFIEKAIEILKDNGLLSFITPQSFLTQSSYQKLRGLLFKGSIEQIIRTSDKVFEGVSVETAIFVYKKSLSKAKTRVMVFDANSRMTTVDESAAKFTLEFAQSEWKGGIINIGGNVDSSALSKKMGETQRILIGVCEFSLGLTPYDKYKGHSEEQIKGRVFHSITQKDEEWKPLLAGGDIQRYNVSWSGKEYIRYGKWLGAPREKRFFDQPRILVRQIISGSPQRIYASYCGDEFYNTQSVFNLLKRPDTKESLIFFLGILNSHLMTWFHRENFLDAGKKTFQKILIQDAKKLPIPKLDLTDKVDKQKHDRMVQLVETMLQLQIEVRGATGSEKTRLDKRIALTDGQIDALVYELYGLDEAEIALVEAT